MTRHGTLTISSRSLFKIVPAGCIMMYAGHSEPDRWFFCDGRLLSKSTYAELYEALQDGSGVCIYGENASDFNIPNLQDEFVRGASSTSDVGQKQQDEIKSHDHGASSDQSGKHDHSMDSAGGHNHDYDKGTELGFIRQNTDQNTSPSEGDLRGHTSTQTTTAGSHTHNINQDGQHSHTITIQQTGGTETRPKNMKLFFIIKY